VSPLEWEKVQLGDVAELEIERVTVQLDAEYRLAGVFIAGRGLFWRDTIFGRDTNYPALHRLRTGQLVMRKLTAWEGPITTVPAEFDGGYVSNEFPTFALDETRLLPEYMRLICQYPEFHGEMRLRTTGTPERRNRLKPEDLLSIEINLPSLDEQRAIVMAVDAFDEALAAGALEREALALLQRGAREQLLGNIEQRDVLLGEVLTGIEGGQSPQCLRRPPGDGEWGVLKLSAVRPGLFRDTEAKALPPGEQPFIASEVRAGDLIITRSNTRERVGAICRVHKTRSRLLLADLTWRLRVDSQRVDPDYLVEALSAGAARQQIEAQATGTSESMKKISQKILRTIEIPLPLPDEQRDIARRLRPFQDATDALEVERLQLVDARVRALELLLSARAHPGMLTEALET
jgi:type I restriction enzyme S subunit